MTQRWQPEVLWWRIALPFGLLFALLIPPFQSPDEPAHFFRAFQVSEGRLFSEKQDQRLGGELPLSLPALRDSFLYLKMNYAARVAPGQVFAGFSMPLDADKRAFCDFPNTAIYAPGAYLPQAAAIVLLRPLGAGPLFLLYACRLANLFVWLALVGLAIRAIPFLKNVLAVLALLPASIVIAASANADVVTNGLCWWILACACAGGRPALRHVAAWVVACANKLIVWPLALLWPRRPLLVALGLLAAIGWSLPAQRQFIPYDAYNPAFRDAQTLNEGVDPARQQAFMLGNPFFFAKTATISAIKALPSAAAHLTGKFGWEKNYLPPVWIALLWLAMAAAMWSADNPLTPQSRWLAAGIFALYVAFFAATMYALWCPVGADEITNFQGRYFVPVLPAAALALSGKRLNNRKKEIWAGGIAILVLANMAMVWAVWGRYYG